MYQMILTEAARVLSERLSKAAVMSIPETAYTMFECLGVSKLNNECSGDCVYELTLPASPISRGGQIAIRSVRISQSGVDLWQSSWSSLSNQGMEFAATYENPQWAVAGNKMRFAGGNRDFSECKMDILMAPGALLETASACVNASTKIPVYEDGDISVIQDMLVAKIVQSMFGTPADNASDGNLSVNK
jgi:hypothetical protein